MKLATVSAVVHLYLFNWLSVILCNAVDCRNGMVAYCKASYLALLTSLTGNLEYGTVEWRPGQPIKSVQPPFALRVGSLIHCCHMKHMHLTASVSHTVILNCWSLLVSCFVMHMNPGHFWLYNSQLILYSFCSFIIVMKGIIIKSNNK